MSRKSQKLVRWIVLVLVLLVLGVLGAGFWLRQSGLPVRSGERPLAALDAGVDVRFDAHGVPHIRAASIEDLATALGWVHANDRITQMELGRRAVAGRLSEILGEATLQVDIHFRTLRGAETAQRLVDVASPRSRVWLEHYAAGVNAWLADRGADLPPELRVLGVDPEPWQPVDSMAFALLMANDLSFWDGRPEEARLQWLRAFGPEAVRDLLGEPTLEVDAELLRYLEEFGEPSSESPVSQTAVGSPGSNNWAVGKGWTASGEAMVSNDPHLGLGLPSVWYQVHLRAPGFAAAGMSLPGTPGVVLGRGESVAWAFTNTMLDDHDLVLEKLDPKGERYLRGGEWKSLEVRRETIPIRGGEGHELVLRSTDLGPLLEADPERGLPPRTLLWTGHTPGDPIAALEGLARATTPEELRRVVESYVVPAQNLVAAFASGELLYQSIGAIPQRRPATTGTDPAVADPASIEETGADQAPTNEVSTEEAPTVQILTANSRLPRLGWGENPGWSGMRPRSTNPHILQPVGDMLVTANADIRPAGYGLPLVADFMPPDREVRIVYRLSDHQQWTPEGFADLHTDRVSLFALEMIDHIRGTYSGDAAKAYDHLVAWDGSMDPQGTSALFALVERGLMALFDDEAVAAGLEPFSDHNRLRWLLAGVMVTDWFDDVSTPETEDRATALAHILATAWREGVERWGDDIGTWDYGALHTLTLRHPLDALPLFGSWARRGPMGIAGSATTVNAFGSEWKDGGQDITFGPSMRWVVDWGQPDSAFGVIPGGQSGHPADPHYDDRLAAFLAGELQPAPWSEDAIERATVSTLRLEP